MIDPSGHFSFAGVLGGVDDFLDGAGKVLSKAGSKVIAFGEAGFNVLSGATTTFTVWWNCKVVTANDASERTALVNLSGFSEAQKTKLLGVVDNTTEFSKLWSIYFAEKSKDKVKDKGNTESQQKEEYRKPKSGSGKEKATDVPSWAKGNKPFKGENGNKFATRLMNGKYGEGNWKPSSPEYSQIRKWGDRGFE